TTSAKTLLLILNRRSFTRRVTLFKHRNIIYRRLAYWNLQHRWIRQPCLRKIIRLLPGEKSQTQTCHKKNAGKYSSESTQKGSRTLTTEYSCRSTGTKRRSRVRTLTLLQQYQHNHT